LKRSRPQFVQSRGCWLISTSASTFVRTKDGRIGYSFVGLARNTDSIKSKSRILLAWIEEGEQVTEEAWVKLIPTLREEDSELWVTWNPENDRAPTNKRFHTKIATPDPAREDCRDELARQPVVSRHPRTAEGQGQSRAAR
jgi:hypothetical protein